MTDQTNVYTKNQKQVLVNTCMLTIWFARLSIEHMNYNKFNLLDNFMYSWTDKKLLHWPHIVFSTNSKWPCKENFTLWRYTTANHTVNKMDSGYVTTKEHAYVFINWYASNRNRFVDTRRVYTEIYVDIFTSIILLTPRPIWFCFKGSIYYPLLSVYIPNNIHCVFYCRICTALIM